MTVQQCVVHTHTAVITKGTALVLHWSRQTHLVSLMLNWEQEKQTLCVSEGNCYCGGRPVEWWRQLEGDGQEALQTGH